MAKDDEIDSVGTLQRRVTQHELDTQDALEEMHQRISKATGIQPEHVGGLIAGALAEHLPKIAEQIEQQHAQRFADLHNRISKLEGESEQHGKLVDAIHKLAAARSDDYQVTKQGTVETPEGTHKVNVVEIHSRRGGKKS